MVLHRFLMGGYVCWDLMDFVGLGFFCLWGFCGFGFIGLGLLLVVE